MAVLAALGIAFAALVGIGIYLASQPTSPSYPQAAAQIITGPASASKVLPPNLLGVDLRADFSIAGAQGSIVAAAGVETVRWPGGALSDRLDPLADNGSGLIYGNSGEPYPPATTMAAFVSWCQPIHCAAIITLPGEINDPAFAALEVNAFVHNFSFEPAYWEIGNEPGLWNHYGIAWADWAPNQTAPPTPPEYAAEVGQYISAIRTIDPHTPIIGLPGIGTGVADEPAWIESTVAANGPNISAVAIHVYPVGTSQENGSLTGFYATLSGPEGLPVRVAADEAAVTAVCSTCHIPILVDEISVGPSSPGSPNTGFPWIPYESAEIVQSIDLNVSTALFWVSQGTYPASWLSPSGSTQPIYSLFSTLFSSLPPIRLATSVSSTVGSLYAAVLGSSPEAPSLLAVVNANASWSVSVNLSSAIPVEAPATLWTWSNGSSDPVSHSGSAGVASTWVLPPGSLLVWRASNSPRHGGGPMGDSPPMVTGGIIPLALEPPQGMGLRPADPVAPLPEFIATVRP